MPKPPGTHSSAHSLTCASGRHVGEHQAAIGAQTGRRVAEASTHARSRQARQHLRGPVKSSCVMRGNRAKTTGNRRLMGDSCNDGYGLFGALSLIRYALAEMTFFPHLPPYRACRAASPSSSSPTSRSWTPPARWPPSRSPGASRPGRTSSRVIAARAGAVRSSCRGQPRSPGLCRAPPASTRSSSPAATVPGAALRCERAARSCAPAPRTPGASPACARDLSCSPPPGCSTAARPTTHWSRSERVPPAPSRRCAWSPTASSCATGRYWTSARASRAGIDLSLALIEEDLGERGRAAHRAAPGRLSPPPGRAVAVLGAAGDAGRSGASPRCSTTCATNLAEPLHGRGAGGTRLHEPAALRPRVPPRDRVTPAKAVERLRAEAARAFLESGTARCSRWRRTLGFNDPERMRRAFVRLFAAPPLRRCAAGCAPGSAFRA